MRLSYLSIPVTRLYELGSATLIKDKFRIQSDLGGLEKRSEKDSVRFCPTRSRGRHRMGRGPDVPIFMGERPGYVWGSRKREWGSGLLQIAVSQQCGTAVRKRAECCRARQEGGVEQKPGVQLFLEGELGRPHRMAHLGSLLVSTHNSASD